MAFMALSFGSSPVFMGTSSPRLHVVMPKPLVTCAAAKRETSGSGGGRGITQPKPISPAMQKFLGVSEIPRTAAIKKIWEYIKEHNLQDPANKKEIVCDENLKSIFAGRERVGFLEVAKLMNPHFIKNE